MVGLNWTEQSINDLISIAEFIGLDSPKFARITIHNIRVRTQQLRKFPYSGRIVPETNNEMIRELIHGNYRIIYLIKENNIVDILTVHHSAKLLFGEKLQKHQI